MTAKSIYRYDWRHGEYASDEKGACDICKAEKLIGDWPDQGGLTAHPDTPSVDLLCDECSLVATGEDLTPIRELHKRAIDEGENRLIALTALALGEYDESEEEARERLGDSLYDAIVGLDLTRSQALVECARILAEQRGPHE